MYDFAKIEKEWTKKWLETGIYEPDLDKAKKPFYNLMMFPYPSAEGLHVGNVYAFTGSDIYGRYKRMRGNDVFEPIGLDGFGIHSENYALKIGTHPMKQSKISEKNFYRQLQMMGNGFAWNERLETYDPDYYKWTQWIFIQMFKNGLAYKKKSSVNWCPSCKTVLADEQVVSGKCERCGTEVTKKDLEQWFFRITKYVEKLLKNLDKIDWPEHIKTAQRNWIGKSEGALLTFSIKNSKEKIEVFTTRPDTIYGATYMVLAPEHSLIHALEDRITNLTMVRSYIKKAQAKTDNERVIDAKSKTGIELTGVKAINPATKKEIPVWIADYVLASYGTGAIMAVPGHDNRDLEFAYKNKLPVKHVIDPGDEYDSHQYHEIFAHDANISEEENFRFNYGKIRRGEKVMVAYAGHGKLINSSEKFDGMDSEKAKWEITKFVSGKKQIQYHLRDWLISRQRYWGPPIPMILCAQCGWQPVPEKDLPVILPNIKEFQPRGKGEAPLATSKAFYEVKCPACDGPARRETDVSDTFLDSAWYYLRYPDRDNKKEAFGKTVTKKWLPIDMYIGGAEHSVLHLLYMRFLAMALKDIGMVDFEDGEPAPKLRTHGMLIKEGTKMSKSKGNVVNPDEYVNKFGADALRMYLMFLGPFQDGGDWRDAGIMGTVRFLNRVWELGEESINPNSIKFTFEDQKEVFPNFHRSIKKITEDIENLKYNTAIAELMMILNVWRAGGVTSSINRKEFEVFLLMLAPFAPFITEELWKNLGNKYSIHKQPWPEYEEKYLLEDTINLIVQVNGKLRATLEVKRGITKKEAEKLALGEASVKRHIKDKPKKAIFVKDRLINFVL